MICRDINGLTYLVESPSHWQLCGYPVELAYLGATQNEKPASGWFLFIADGGHVTTHPLDSRDHGHTLIERAFRRLDHDPHHA